MTREEAKLCAEVERQREQIAGLCEVMLKAVADIEAVQAGLRAVLNGVEFDRLAESTP